MKWVPASPSVGGRPGYNEQMKSWSLHLVDQLQRRADQVGVERFRLAKAEESQVMGEATRLLQTGLPSHDPKVRGLARRARDLRKIISGDDVHFENRLRRLNNEGYLRQGKEGPYVDPAVFRYLERALNP